MKNERKMAIKLNDDMTRALIMRSKFGQKKQKIRSRFCSSLKHLQV